jgi:carbonic anhydrase/acetyltransferase-like protein (isoleucine patch superfamily)
MVIGFIGVNADVAGDIIVTQSAVVKYVTSVGIQWDSASVTDGFNEALIQLGWTFHVITSLILYIHKTCQVSENLF